MTCTLSFCISGYPWRHGLIGKSFRNAIWLWPSNVSAPPSPNITCTQHHFCSWWLRRIDWTPWIRLLWNKIHKWCFSRRAHCGGDLTLLITDMKSTEKERASVFMLLSSVIWFVLQRKNIIMHYDNPNNPTQRHTHKTQHNAIHLSNNNPLQMLKINKINIICLSLFISLNICELNILFCYKMFQPLESFKCLHPADVIM